jgi:hypothetical protein
MMKQAGIDPVLIGHRGKKSVSKPAQPSYSRNDKRSHSSGEINKMRNFLDDKIAKLAERRQRLINLHTNGRII